MAKPTIATTGTASKLFLITDHEGLAHRIPINSICDIVNSSNGAVYRIDVCHMQGTVTLKFDNDTEVAAAIILFEAQF